MSYTLGEVMTSYIKLGVWADTDGIYNDIRRNADGHITGANRAWSPVSFPLVP